MAIPDPDAPTQRILTVIDTISRLGPITLVDLTKELPNISRAAIWRAVDTLRAAGWLRMRAGDNAFEIRVQMRDRLSDGHLSNPVIDSLIPIFDQLASFGPVHVDIAGFIETGLCKIIETTRKPSALAPALSLVDDDLALAAQLNISAPQLVVHLRSFLVTAKTEERRVVTSGEHGRTIARLREIGHIWSPDHSAIAISLPNYPAYAMRAELWRITKADLRVFQNKTTAFLATQFAPSPPDIAI